MSDNILETRLNVRVKGSMAEHVEHLVGSQGLYENQSEYVRDLIRHDMDSYAIERTRQSIMQGYKDLGSGKCKAFTNMKDAVHYGRTIRQHRAG